MTYFTLNYTEKQQVCGRSRRLDVRKPEERPLLSCLMHILDEKQAQKSFFGKDPVFIRSVGQFQSY